MMSQSTLGQEQKPVAVGPWGGQNGSYWDDGVYSSIRQIIINHGAGIDAIQIEYDKLGIPVWSNKHGGTGGYKTDKIKLDFPEEFLTSIHGYYGNLYKGGPVCIRSLTFTSNENTYGPYGVEQGTYFSCPMTGDKIVGLKGRSGWYLDAIGAHIKPHKTTNASNAMVYKDGSGTTTSEKFGYSLIQGSIGKNYDVVVAIRQNNGQTLANPSPAFSTRSSSSDSSDSDKKESKKKILALPPSYENTNAKSGRPVTYGPWGGEGGYLFDDGVYTGVRQVYLSRNFGGIVWIRALYDQNGQPVWGYKDGGTGGFKTDKIIFDYPYELLTHISGYFGTTMLMGPTIIRSLTFHTTKRKYGPYGEEFGLPFSSDLKEGTIVGFHGRKGLFVDAIGVHVIEGKVTPPVRPPCSPIPQKKDETLGSDGDKALWHEKPAGTVQPFPIPSPQRKDEASATDSTDKSLWHAKPLGAATDSARPPWHVKPLGLGSDSDKPLWPAKPHADKHVHFEEIHHGVVNEPAPCGPGPWGGDGGKPWDDGVYTGIKQIYITRAEVICSIQIEYDRNGQSIWSVKHGGNSGNITHRIMLEYPDELLTCISGYYGHFSKEGNAKVIKSLTFYTSRGKYGPYGDEVGTYFTSTKTEGKVVGFHGKSGSYLDAIGVHMQHWLGSYRRPKASLFKMFS